MTVSTWPPRSTKVTNGPQCWPMKDMSRARIKPFRFPVLFLGMASGPSLPVLLVPPFLPVHTHTSPAR